MVNKSLGLIEVVGLAAALEAADAALKAANVKLLGYELTQGGGLVVVKLCGDVGAVTAGVQAGKTAASKVSKAWSTHVIPRPHDQLSCIVVQDTKLKKQGQSLETIPTVSQVIQEEEEVVEETSEPAEMIVDVVAENENSVVEEDVIPEEQDSNLLTSEENHENLATDDSLENIEKKRAEDICNLCNDPACHRKKGDPKITCIYYVKNN